MTTKSGILRTPECRCLHCGYRLTAVGPTDGSSIKAEPGDLTQCMKCGAVMALADDLTVRRLTDLEVSEIRGDPELLYELARIKRGIDVVHLLMRAERQ